MQTQVSPAKNEVLYNQSLNYPCVSIDISKYMMRQLQLQSVQKCIADRKIEQRTNRNFAKRLYIKLIRQHDVSETQSRIFWEFLQIQDWDQDDKKNRTIHYLVAMMDSATMYSRAKEAREFHHNFLCFSCLNLGLPLDWLALIPAALHEGKDDLQNLSKYVPDTLRKRITKLVSAQGLQLPNGDIVRIDTHSLDGSALRGETCHVPGTNWNKAVPHSSAEKDFLLRHLIAIRIHDKDFYRPLQQVYLAVCHDQ